MRQSLGNEAKSLGLGKLVVSDEQREKIGLAETECPIPLSPGTEAKRGEGKIKEAQQERPSIARHRTGTGVPKLASKQSDDDGELLGQCKSLAIDRSLQIGGTVRSATGSLCLDHHMAKAYQKRGRKVVCIQ